MFVKGIGLFILCISVGLGLLHREDEMQHKLPATEVTQGMVVVELFTSQGCSSCPPADKLLGELAADPELKDRVIPLSYHVDYWNYLGWRDPFSKKEWTARQGDYVQAFDGTTMYTPQMVIQGREELVGSRARSVRRIVKDQVISPKAHQIKLEIMDLRRGANEIEATIRMDGVLPDGREKYQLVGVLFEKGLSTEVPRGENAGRTLKNDFVVRNMQKIAQLQKPSSLEATHHFKMKFDEDLNASQLGLAVFVQGNHSMQIIGAAVQR